MSQRIDYRGQCEWSDITRRKIVVDTKADSMQRVREICTEAIQARLATAAELLESAKACLAEGDYFQSAVRLQMLEQVSRFEEFQLGIFDTASARES